MPSFEVDAIISSQLFPLSIEYSNFTKLAVGRVGAVQVMVVDVPKQNEVLVFGAVTVIVGAAIVKLTLLMSDIEVVLQSEVIRINEETDVV